MSNPRKNIIRRTILLGLGLLLVMLCVGYKLVNIQVNEKEEYSNFAQENNFRTAKITGERGNLYSSDGILLATTVTEHNIYWDPLTVSKKLFNSELEALCDSLSQFLNKPSKSIYNRFYKARKDSVRYLKIASKLNFEEYARIKSFPIFKEGQNKGGFIHEPKSRRKLASGDVGRRTLGYDKDSIKAGLEGAYSHLLRGTVGTRIERFLGRGHWRPIDEWIKVPRDGADVFTTINSVLQNATYHALHKQLINFEAEKGCAIVMEVATGKVRAMVNLAKVNDGSYQDIQNYAVWESAEPGSTIKPMHILAGLEDGVFTAEQTVQTGAGLYRIYGRDVRDSHANWTITVAQTIEQSSNIGMVKLINSAYRSEPEKLIKYFKKWNLDKPQGIDISGEGIPEIPNPENAKWSHQTLASFSFGYETKLTPLQILSFYNGIANNGKLLKPLFLEKVIRKGEQKTYNSVVLNESMADSSSIAAIQEMLVNVVKRGTAKKLKSNKYEFAGKTGTAKVEYWLGPNHKEYRGSFAGYFPADKPKYSCYVMVYKPNTKKGFYGAEVAAPVFREVADKIYALTPKKTKVSQPKLNKKPEPFTLVNRKKIPNLRGKAGSEVIPELENWGLDVKYEGFGRITKQSIPAGRSFRDGQTIYLKLRP